VSESETGPVLIGRTRINPTAEISPFTVIGYEGDRAEAKQHHHDLVTQIERGVNIGPFVTIYSGARLGDAVKVDPYVRIGRNTEVGARTSVLYGSRIHDDVTVGEDCIIAGNVSNRVRIGARVMHHGRLAHRYNRPHAGWRETDEPSMIIEDDVVIGAGSLLVGDISVGRRSYIAAGEIVRRDVPQYCIVCKGKVVPAEDWKGSLADFGFWQD
jgi:acetyltransferase-like isoleucine patch superfamily enzyme